MVAKCGQLAVGGLCSMSANGWFVVSDAKLPPATQDRPSLLGDQSNRRAGGRVEVVTTVTLYGNVPFRVR